MEKIHLVMPMGGGGTRFAKDMKEVPKPLIELQGKPFFYWATQSIINSVEVEDIIFIVLREHVINYEIDKAIRSYYPNAIIVTIPQVLNGAVLTCLEGIKSINDSLPILFNDCDHAFWSEAFYEFVRKGNFKQVDGALLTFESNCPSYSYVIFDSKGNVSGTIEKEVVSNEAICGAYYFKNKSVFTGAVDRYLTNCGYSEYFISGVYKELVASHKNVITFPLDEHISFGTPAEYEQAKECKSLLKYEG